ncbi:MAG: uracil-xanthine permease, partial [Symploca sp. SIO2D2]|nr:uracil-xanthine permease [Symploca sp. SIO2D2]
YYIAKDLGASSAWYSSAFVAGIVVAILVATQITKKKALRMYAPILAIAIGYLLSGFLGIIKWPAFETDKWLMIPTPLAYGLAFKWELLVPFAIIYIVSSIEAIGDLSATATFSGMKTKGLEFWQRIRGGILSDAITSAFSCFFNGFPTATFSQNNGVIQLTGVGSRQVGFYVSGILITAALIPQTGYFFSAMPNPVLGGVTLVLFGMIASAGVRMILQEPLDGGNMLTIAVSLGLAFSIPSQEAFVEALPEFLAAIFSSKVATAGLAAMVMNVIVLKTMKEKA